MMTLTKAAHDYIARLYELFIDKGLNLEEIRLALAQHGIKRNLYQIEFDLDHRYSFAGYAAKHPAPPRLTLAQLDELEQAKANKPARVLLRSTIAQNL